MRWARARLRPCDITQRTTKLKLRGSDNCRHYTNHGSHTCRPTELALARSREEEVGNRRKRVSSERERAGWDGVKAAADHRIAADRRPFRNISFSRCDCPYLRIDDDEHRGVGILISAGVCSGHRREDIGRMFLCEDIFIWLEMSLSAIYERANGAELTYQRRLRSRAQQGERKISLRSFYFSSIRIVRGRGGKLNERR